MYTKKKRTQSAIQCLTLCFHTLKQMESSSNPNDKDSAELYRSYCTQSLKELKDLGFEVTIPGL
jgi:hypothetical protein